MLLSENRGSALNIVVIGGGATGVELAAELQFVCLRALQYQFKSLLSFPQITINIIENSPRILPALPEKISDSTLQVLNQRKIKVFSGQKVTLITQTEVHTDTGLKISADLKIWCAGIQAPAFLKNLDMETNERNQIVVKQNLQSATDNAIFAFGDCAYCFLPRLKQAVPPRAQAAYQQALLLTKSLKKYIVDHKALLDYEYKDYGSLISLSRRKTLGILVGRWLGTITLEGKFARFAYLFLYRRHQAVLWGWWPVILLSLSQLLAKAVQPQLKLH